MGCEENYIGESKIKFRKRMTLHQQDIRDSKYRILLASTHIAQCARNKETNFAVFPFDKMTTEDDYTRRAKEEFFYQEV